MKSPSFLSNPWAARLVLLVASISAVATSRASNEAYTDLQGAPLTLTTEQPKATRHLRVRISAQESAPWRVFVHLNVVLSAVWKPGPTPSALNPLLRGRLQAPGDEAAPWSSLAEFHTPPSPESFASTTLQVPDAHFALECTLSKDCEWRLPLELELQSRGAEGAVEVQWQASARVNTDDSEEYEYIEGFAIEVTEE